MVMNEGARASIEFLHSLPEPFQRAAWLGMIAVVVCIVGAAVARGVR